MSHGTPDFSQTSGVNTVYQLTDMAELAARLGSIVTFDRRGDVVFLDDFENGISKCSIAGVGVGSAAYLSKYTARSGLYSVKLIGGSSFALIAVYQHSQPIIVESKAGLEVSFTKAVNCDYVSFALVVHTGLLRKWFALRFNFVDNTIEVYDSTAAYVVIGGLPNFYASDALFNTMKIVVDVVDTKYIRLIINNKTYDISVNECSVIAEVAAPYLFVDIQVTSAADENGYMYLDDVIITQNEH